MLNGDWKRETQKLLLGSGELGQTKFFAILLELLVFLFRVYQIMCIFGNLVVFIVCDLIAILYFCVDHFFID